MTGMNAAQRQRAMDWNRTMTSGNLPSDAEVAAHNRQSRVPTYGEVMMQAEEAQRVARAEARSGNAMQRMVSGFDENDSGERARLEAQAASYRPEMDAQIGKLESAIATLEASGSRVPAEWRIDLGLMVGARDAVRALES